MLDAQSQDVDEVESAAATPEDDAAKRSADFDADAGDSDSEVSDSEVSDSEALDSELSEELATADGRAHELELSESDGPASQRARTRVSDEERQAEKLYDYELVDRFKAGDQSAFEELFSRTREKVFRVAYKVLLNEDDALDVVQDTFITAHKALLDFERRAAVSTWLCQVAVNRSIDLRRRKKVRGNESTDYFGATSGDKLARGETAEREDFNPVEGALSRELEERLAQALEEIGEKHRMVFVLYTLEGLSYKDIADKLGISIGTVMSRLFYSRKKLQSLLADFALTDFASDGLHIGTNKSNRELEGGEQ